MINSFMLVPEYGVSVTLNVADSNSPYIIEDILQINKYVYEDRSYRLDVDDDANIKNIDIYLNGDKVDTIISNKSISFVDTNTGSKIFKNRMGFVQMSIHIYYDDGTERWCHSEYAAILIKATEKNKKLDAMLSYIYEHQEDILKSSTSRIKQGDNTVDSYEDFWAQIVLLDDIANLYEEFYGFFKANSRQKLEQVEVVDRVEKLQYFGAKTVEYIVQHPENFRREKIGIKYGKETFLPQKALMLQNRLTQNIYENQVVLGFLATVRLHAIELQKSINKMLESLSAEKNEKEGYIFSAYYIFLSAYKNLEEYLVRIEDVIKRLDYLYTSYHNILNAEEFDFQSQPKPTTIFQAVPQYNRIYMSIIKWFSKTGYQFEKEKAMLGFIDTASIYEAYVLTKLVSYIQNMEFSLVNASIVEYPRKVNWKYRSKDYNNTFCFEKDNVKLTLYYEPIIYNDDKREVNGISLYRNNSISLNHDDEEERRGSYYVPDYIIKIEKEKKESYVIIDAKYSYLDNIKHKLIPDLSYKYIFSISPLCKEANVLGMAIIYGLNDNNENIESFYDNQLGDEIRPLADIIPLSEALNEDMQDKNAYRFSAKIERLSREM